MSSAREKGIIEKPSNHPVAEKVGRWLAGRDYGQRGTNRNDPVSAAVCLPGRVEVDPWVPRRAWSSTCPTKDPPQELEALGLSRSGCRSEGMADRSSIVKSRMSFHVENLVARLVANDGGVSMTPSTVLSSSVEVESFIYDYFDAWGGTDEDRIMSYYAENVTVQIPGTLMQGRSAVREQFVRPFITAFPGNRHVVKSWIFGRDVVVVEWTFEAKHKGPFAGRPATQAFVQAPGCGVYEYDPSKRQVTAARIYFDVGMILKQIIDPRDPMDTYW